MKTHQNLWINDKTRRNSPKNNLEELLGEIVPKQRAAASLGCSSCSKAAGLPWLPRTLRTTGPAELRSREAASGTAAPGQERPPCSARLPVGKRSVPAFCSWPQPGLAGLIPFPVCNVLKRDLFVSSPPGHSFAPQNTEGLRPQQQALSQSCL